MSAWATTLYNEFENYTFKVTATNESTQFDKDIPGLIQQGRYWNYPDIWLHNSSSCVDKSKMFPARINNGKVASLYTMDTVPCQAMLTTSYISTQANWGSYSLTIDEYRIKLDETMS